MPAAEYINNPQGIKIERREYYEFLKNDISPRFRMATPESCAMALALQRLQGTPVAIRYFAQHCDSLDDYSYWFLLGTAWVQYSGWSDLDMWKTLFSSGRPNRESSLMKPFELKMFRHILPKTVACFRAHRQGEKDWISYTLDLDTARRFAESRGTAKIHQYHIPRKYLLALFLRRHEYEVLCLDKSRTQLISVINI